MENTQLHGWTMQRWDKIKRQGRAVERGAGVAGWETWTGGRNYLWLMSLELLL